MRRADFIVAAQPASGILLACAATRRSSPAPRDATGQTRRRMRSPPPLLHRGLDMLGAFVVELLQTQPRTILAATFYCDIWRPGARLWHRRGVVAILSAMRIIETVFPMAKIPAPARLDDPAPSIAGPVAAEAGPAPERGS